MYCLKLPVFLLAEKIRLYYPFFAVAFFLFFEEAFLVTVFLATVCLVTVVGVAALVAVAFFTTDS
jgi:hypothetical protein